jgi:hypothetical protein
MILVERITKMALFSMIFVERITKMALFSMILVERITKNSQLPPKSLLTAEAIGLISNNQISG